MSENKVKKVAVNTTFNGEEMDILVDPYISLLETLREVVGITGTKEGCNDGNCGACTINLDGRIVDSCLVLPPTIFKKFSRWLEKITSASLYT